MAHLAQQSDKEVFCDAFAAILGMLTMLTQLLESTDQSLLMRRSLQYLISGSSDLQDIGLGMLPMLTSALESRDKLQNSFCCRSRIARRNFRRLTTLVLGSADFIFFKPKQQSISGHC